MLDAGGAETGRARIRLEDIVPVGGEELALRARAVAVGERGVGRDAHAGEEDAKRVAPRGDHIGANSGCAADFALHAADVAVSGGRAGARCIGGDDRVGDVEEALGRVSRAAGRDRSVAGRRAEVCVVRDDRQAVERVHDAFCVRQVGDGADAGAVVETARHGGDLLRRSHDSGLAVSGARADVNQRAGRRVARAAAILCEGRVVAEDVPGQLFERVRALEVQSADAGGAHSDCKER